MALLGAHHILHVSGIRVKNNIKMYIKTTPTCFGVTVTPSSGSALIVLTEITVIKIVP